MMGEKIWYERIIQSVNKFRINYRFARLCNILPCAILLVKVNNHEAHG